MKFIHRNNKENILSSDQKKKPELNEHNQTMVGAGVAIGIGVGVAIGSAVGNIGAGLAIGISIGIVVGVSLQKKKKTDQEKEKPE
jgi:hypothetical protein